MQPQQPTGRVLAGRRADAGTVRLGERDITGLMLCGDHYGAPYHLLAAALDIRPDRLRAIVARWRHAGYAETGTLARVSAPVLRPLGQANSKWSRRPPHQGTVVSPGRSAWRRTGE